MTTTLNWRRTRLTRADGSPIPDDWTLEDETGQPLGRISALSQTAENRTAITNWDQKISSIAGSLRDVQPLSWHSSIATTHRYIEVSEDDCRKVVGKKKPTVFQI